MNTTIVHVDFLCNRNTVFFELVMSFRTTTEKYYKAGTKLHKIGNQHFRTFAITATTVIPLQPCAFLPRHRNYRVGFLLKKLVSAQTNIIESQKPQISPSGSPLLPHTKHVTLCFETWSNAAAVHTLLWSVGCCKKKDGGLWCWEWGKQWKEAQKRREDEQINGCSAQVGRGWKWEWF